LRHILAVALLVLAALPLRAQQGDVTGFTLENGLEVVVIADHRAPVVAHMVWYRVGAADEPPGQSGIAHFLEHLMFKGTPTTPEGTFSRTIRAQGGEDNAFTANDYTGYHQRIAADRLPLVMAMEADRMVNLDPSEAAVHSERDVVMEERRQVVENTAGGLFNEQRRAALYLNHPYRNPVIGWMHEIEGYTRDMAMDFYRAHYAPNNAILIVAGDVTAEAVRVLAEEHYGPLPPSDAIPPRLRPQEPPHLAPRRLEFRDARVKNPSVSRTYLAPPRRSGDQAEAAALYVLAELLGGSGVTSVFARELVHGEGLALDAGAFYSETGIDPQTFGLYVVPRPGVSLAEAEARMDELVARMIAEGPDPADLDRIKTRIRAAETYALDNLHRRARRIGVELTSGLTLDDSRAWPAALAAVTPEDVQVAAAAVFRTEYSVTGWLMAADTPELMQ
jgi:zinc protease